MGKTACSSEEGLNKGAWSSQEDQILTDYIKTHGEGKWRNIPKQAGLKRCGKSCRLRWLNYLRPNIKRGNISLEEEDLIIRLHKLLGNRWSLIAGRLPGRTDNEIKNYWNTTLLKKIQGKQSKLRSKNEKTKVTPKPHELDNIGIISVAADHAASEEKLNLENKVKDNIITNTSCQKDNSGKQAWNFKVEEFLVSDKSSDIDFWKLCHELSETFDSEEGGGSSTSSSSYGELRRKYWPSSCQPLLFSEEIMLEEWIKKDDIVGCTHQKLTKIDELLNDRLNWNSS
ncbi:transcription factor WER [Ziziphus jujuba]|uniref:Transcription factor WER n=2 Tax=Ziziphus jujuba TaxID=326968 RepID=A0ABM3INV8_ZIZJJ|nr:transcription factor WER [Ziziphus jujuba]KAH7523874.1 hypothetical protein FEM48_Zijuj06G0058300 [Ziziphus jujuba var. spinosa]